MRKALRCRPAQDVDPEQIGTAFCGEGIFQRTDIQRRRVKLVGEIGIVLVVRLAVDVDLVEVLERIPDTKSHEAQLEQGEEKQRNNDDRNEREEFVPGVMHGTRSSHDRLNLIVIGKCGCCS